MSRSNAPLALSVVNLTVPGDVGATLRNITRFDDDDFGFNHTQTWNAFPFALRGEFNPEGVLKSFKKVPPRVQRCVTALCAYGKAKPLQTRRFADFPESGLKTTAAIDWDPEVRVRVKGSCWYVEGEQVVIPLLQPRKLALHLEQLAVYLRLGRQAFCQGDWVDAVVRAYDLSGEADIPSVNVIDEKMVPGISDSTLSIWVKTYIEAKKEADRVRASRPAKSVTTPMDEILGMK